VTNVEKARIWKDATTKINALGLAPRTVKEIKDKWRNLKAKSTFTEYRREVNMTGGGPAPKRPTSSVEKIVNMMQDTASFAGIEGCLQTTGFINEQKGIYKMLHIHYYGDVSLFLSKLQVKKKPKQIINNVNIDKSVSICSI